MSTPKLYEKDAVNSRSLGELVQRQDAGDDATNSLTDYYILVHYYKLNRLLHKKYTYS